MKKPNPYLGLHDVTIVEISSQFQEAVLDSCEDQLVEVAPEDLYFRIALVLDNTLPYGLIWPSHCIETVTDCFGVRTEELLDSHPYALVGLTGKAHFYQIKLKGHELGPICSPIKKES